MAAFRFDIEQEGVRIAFPTKPADAVRAMLKAAGFRWARLPEGGGYWWRRATADAADFIRRLDLAINGRRPDGPCWACGDPAGYLRSEGAASPVRCDACQIASRDQAAGRGDEYTERERTYGSLSSLAARMTSK